MRPAAGQRDTFLAKAAVQQKSIYRIERRSKTPGRIIKAMKRAEWLEDHRKHLSALDQERARAYVEKQLKLALEDLAQEDQAALLKAVQGDKDSPLDCPEAPRVTIKERHDQLELGIDQIELPAEPIGDYLALVRVRLGEQPIIVARQLPQAVSGRTRRRQ